MKNQVLNIFTVVALCFAVVGCKKAKEADTSEAETVAVSESTSDKYIVNIDDSSVYWTGSKPTGSHSGIIKLESGVFKVENETLTSGTFQVNRADYNIKYKSQSFFNDLKEKFINDEFDLQVTIVAKK